jgi:heme-degrading monooxygenase HmoA
MIARVWRGATSAEDAEAYARYMGSTGIDELKGTPGNEGVFMLRRVDGDRAEFIVMSLWSSEEAIRAFAGDDISVAVFYPEDDRYLVERELTATHYDVVDHR